MSSPNKRRVRQQGFSMIEMMVSLLVSSILLTAFVSFFTTQSHSMQLQDARRSAQRNARGAMDFIVRNINHIGRAHATRFDATNPAIQDASADSIHYLTNLSEDWSDDDVTDGWEDVSFLYDNSNLAVRCTDANSGFDALVTEGPGGRRESYVPAGGLAFTYYDAAGNVIAPPGTGDAAARDSIRRIRVSLTVHGDVSSGETEPTVTLSQDVFLRNG